MSNDNKVIPLSTKILSAKDWTVEIMLKQLLTDLSLGETGINSPKKAIVILLDDTETEKGSLYDTQYYQAGMGSSEIVTLLEVEKAKFLKYLIPDYDGE